MVNNLVSLGDYVKILSGYAFKSSLFNNNQEGMPLIRIRDVTSGETNTYYSGDYSEQYVVKSGDFLITMDGEFKIKKWTGEDALLNQRVCKIESDSELLDTEYLLYLMPSILKKIEDRTSFVTVKHLSVKEIQKELVNLPSLVQQRKMVEVLNETNSIINKRQSQITALDELTQSLFLEMFGDPRGVERKYPIEPLENLAIKITDGEHTTPRRTNSGIKLLSARNVKNRRLDYSVGVDYIDKTEYERISKRCNPKKGDVLLTCSGTIGRTCVVREDEPFGLVRSVALVKLKQDLIIPEYIEAYFLTPFIQAYFKKSVNQSSQANLFGNQIKKIPILLPPISEQVQYYEIIKKIDEEKIKIEQSFNKLNELFNSLLQKAFKGELFQDE